MQHPIHIHLADRGSVELRLLTQSGNQLAELEKLTILLHRAYAPLAERGMRYVASWQDVNITRARCAKGDTFVGVLNKQIVATVTLCPPDVNNQNAYYHQSSVAYFQQFAVAPDLQGCGLGSQIMDFLELEARRRAYHELALDTSENATELINFYIKRGYTIVARQNWQETNYASVVLSKTLQAKF